MKQRNWPITYDFNIDLKCILSPTLVDDHARATTFVSRSSLLASNNPFLWFNLVAVDNDITLHQTRWLGCMAMFNVNGDGVTIKVSRSMFFLIKVCIAVFTYDIIATRHHKCLPQ